MTTLATSSRKSGGPGLRRSALLLSRKVLPAKGLRHRPQRSESVSQRVERIASPAAAGPSEQLTCYTIRCLFATHAHEDSIDVRTARDLLGRANVSTTMVHTHVLDRRLAGVRSWADGLVEGGRFDGD
jgi:site-specific recombinase XerD